MRSAAGYPSANRWCERWFGGVLLCLLPVLVAGGCASIPVDGLQTVEPVNRVENNHEPNPPRTVQLTASEAVAVPRIRPVHLPMMPRQQRVEPAGPGGPDPDLVDEFPDEFVIGYGLDYAERYRNLPFIGILKPEVYA